MSTRLSTATVVARRIRRQRVEAICREIQDLNIAFVSFRIDAETYAPKHRELVESLRRAQAER